MENVTEEQKERLSQYISDIEKSEDYVKELKADLVAAIMKDDIPTVFDKYNEYIMSVPVLALLKHIKTGEEPEY